jgi:hypothetical protein
MLGINCGSSSRFSAAVLPHGAAPAGVSRGPAAIQSQVSSLGRTTIAALCGVMMSGP